MDKQPEQANSVVSRADGDALGGRLPLLDPRTLRADQRQLYDAMRELLVPEAEREGYQAILPDGRFIGPFNAFLYMPALARGLQAWRQAQQSSVPLVREVQETVILVVGAVWGADYELYAHTAAGRKAGLPDAAIGAIRAGQEPEGVSSQVSVAYRFANELVRTHEVTDSTYAETVATFGQEGVLGLLNVVSWYLMISALLNTFRVPEPLQAG